MPRVELAVDVANLLEGSRTSRATNPLQGAGHAVLRTLYSRAHRIGLNGASWLSRGLRKNVSFDLLSVDVARVLAKPAFEFIVSLEQELERFADYVGRICADELSVSVEVVLDFFLRSNLNGCSFGLFRWCFQKCPVLFLSLVIRLAAQGAS